MIMEKKTYREIIEKAGRWLKTNRKLLVYVGLTAAAIMATAGVMLCALRTAPLPAAREAAIQNAEAAEEAAQGETLQTESTLQTTAEVKETAPEARSLQAESTLQTTAEVKETASGTEALQTESTLQAGETREETAREAEVLQAAEVPEAVVQVTEEHTDESRGMAPETGGSGQSEQADGSSEEVTAEKNVHGNHPVPETAVAEETEDQPAPPAVQAEAEQAVETAVHVHDWAPVTVTVHHDAVTHTVHHDAVTEMVHHDPVTHEEPVYEYRTICNTCGEDITGQIPDHIGLVCQGSYSVQQIQTGVNIVTDREAYDEEVVTENARDETIVDQEARDEVITAGWRCSICGIMKE